MPSVRMNFGASTIYFTAAFANGATAGTKLLFLSITPRSRCTSRPAPCLPHCGIAGAQRHPPACLPRGPGPGLGLGDGPWGGLRCCRCCAPCRSAGITAPWGQLGCSPDWSECGTIPAASEIELILLFPLVASGGIHALRRAEHDPKRVRCLRRRFGARGVNQPAGPRVESKYSHQRRRKRTLPRASSFRTLATSILIAFTPPDCSKLSLCYFVLFSPGRPPARRVERS